jgi:hypothetical protein
VGGSNKREKFCKREEGEKGRDEMRGKRRRRGGKR